MTTILRKELADYFTSIRCFILFLLVFVASAFAIYAARQGIFEASLDPGPIFIKLFTTGEDIPSLAEFIALLIPVIGIALSFDAINSERSSGTLNRILSQPVYRDSVINGKFLAGVVILSIMVGVTILLVGGYGLRMIGVPPTAEEIIRLFIYFISAVIYGAFWMGLAILFSVLFRNLAVSLLCPLAIWILLGIPASVFNPYISFIVPAITDSIGTALMLARLSPYFLFQEATMVLLIPAWRGWGLLTTSTTSSMLLNPLSLDQSLLIIWPQLTVLIALTAICFAISYVVFMRQEIRST
ncbi:MAG: ABC transporter permease subunit [Dehalococcoidales bacterium]|nr:ABC transporter permease subunit [Dehalococcoidales bacterium]